MTTGSIMTLLIANAYNALYVCSDSRKRFDNMFVFISADNSSNSEQKGEKVRGRSLLVLILLVSSFILVKATESETNPCIVDMLSDVSESEIYSSVYQLQNFSTRKYGTAGNLNAGTYLYNRLSEIPRLNVEFQSSYRNIIATLNGTDPTSKATYTVGAHYDSTSSDPNNAPGATDDGGGVAIVLELARIMSHYEFRHTLKFALWNYEEGGMVGSTDYAQYALTSGLNVSLYFNYDSTCYDPDNRFVLDIMYNSKSAWVKDLMTQHNTLYAVGFTLTYNAHTCSSDHIPFWARGFTAVMTHEETHGPAHTPNDTVDKVNLLYAKKNGQLGISVLAKLAEVESLIGDINADCIVDVQDLHLLSEGYGATSSDTTWNTDADLNDDGVVGVHDLYMLSKNHRLMGDINTDYLVDEEDLRLLNKAYGAVPDSTNWNAAADLNNDETISVRDLSVLARNYG